MNLNRRSKREVITINDDDSPSEQPTEKSRKKNVEPIPSEEILELQKKVIDLQLTVIKLEKNYQGSCRIAGEAQARVQSLENLLDSKPKVADGSNTVELENKVNELTNLLEDERMKHGARVNQLTKQLVEERMSHSARIDDLTAKLAKYEGLPQPPPMLQPQQHPAAMQLQNVVAVPVSHPVKVVRIYDNEHPTNILQLYRAGMVKSVGLDSALWQLKAKFNECGTEKLYHRLRIGGYMQLDCEVCDMKLPKYYVLSHFLSADHVEKVRAHGAAVSLSAYQYWLRLLQEAIAAPVEAAAAAAVPLAHNQLMPAAPAAQQVAAAAPSTGVKSSLKRVPKKEPKSI